jgi:hypothetical protein
MATTVQDSREECRTRLEMCSNSAGAFASYLPSHAGRNDWDPVVGSPNGTAGPDPPGSLSVSLEPMFSRAEKIRRQLLEWNVPDPGDPFDWNACSLVWIMMIRVGR